MFPLLVVLASAEPIVKFANLSTNSCLNSRDQTLDAHSFQFYGNGLVVRAQIDELMLRDADTLRPAHLERTVRVLSLFCKGKSLPLDIQLVIGGPLSVSTPEKIRELMGLVNRSDDLKTIVNRFCWINPFVVTSRSALESTVVMRDRSHFGAFLRPLVVDYAERPPQLPTRAVPFVENAYFRELTGFDYLLDSGVRLGRLSADRNGGYDLTAFCDFWYRSVYLALFFYKTEAITESDQPDLKTICSHLNLLPSPELYYNSSGYCAFRSFRHSRWAFAEDNTPTLLQVTCPFGDGIWRVYDNVSLPAQMADGIRSDVDSLKSEYTTFGLPLRTIDREPMSWQCLAFLRSSFFSSDLCELLRLNQSQPPSVHL